jgi:hypothetical protein
MHGTLSPASAVARVVASDSGSDAFPEPEIFSESGSEDRGWFYDAALQICGTKDPGYQLHLFTGWPLTSCRYFMLRDADQRRKPSPEFLRILIRSRHGEPFFRAFMHGCDARWFTDLVRSEERARDAEQSLRVIHEQSRPK